VMAPPLPREFGVHAAASAAKRATRPIDAVFGMLVHAAPFFLAFENLDVRDRSKQRILLLRGEVFGWTGSVGLSWGRPCQPHSSSSDASLGRQQPSGSCAPTHAPRG